jgi:hypothetical protein
VRLTLAGTAPGAGAAFCGPKVVDPVDVPDELLVEGNVPAECEPPPHAAKTIATTAHATDRGRGTGDITLLAATAR